MPVLRVNDVQGLGLFDSSVGQGPRRCKKKGEMMFEEMTAAQYQESMKKGAKYHNRKVEYAGIMFDSVKERDRYKWLLIFERTGEIRDLQLQVEFELVPAEPGIRKTVYRADFCYEEKQADGTWARIVEDVKSPATRKNPVYQLKKKLMRTRYGITIREE